MKLKIPDQVDAVLGSTLCCICQVPCSYPKDFPASSCENPSSIQNGRHFASHQAFAVSIANWGLGSREVNFGILFQGGYSSPTVIFMFISSLTGGTNELLLSF